MTATTGRPLKRRKGFVLSFAIVLIAVLSISGLSLLGLGLQARIMAVRITAEMSARAAADAGLTKALFEMNKSLAFVQRWKPNDVASSFDAAFSTASSSFTYTIEKTAGGAEYKITSTGQSGGAQKTVSVTVRRQGLFDYGVFSSGYAHPKHKKGEKWPGRRKPPKKGGHLKIKGYNVGTYSSNPAITPSGELVLRTNSKHHKAVKLEKDALINGDIIVGPGGNPDRVIEVKSGAEVTGDTYTADKMLEPLAVIVPENLNEMKGEKFEIKKDKGDGKPLKLTGNLRFEDFKIEDEQVIEVQGNVTMYVEGEMKLKHGAQLIITKNSSLTLYVGKKLEIHSHTPDGVGGLINETKDPTKLMIYGTDTCEKIKLEHMDDFYGAVYAPYAKVEMKRIGDIYGAFLGWEVKLEKDRHDDNPSFYFDEALRSSEDGNFRIVRGAWREE